MKFQTTNRFLFNSMKKAFLLQFTSVILTVSILFSSCASTTLIQSYPSDAKVYVDGEYAGRTPYWYTDSKILGSRTDIDILKDGYEPLYTTIFRNEQLDFGAVLCGFYVWVPFLWSLKYKPAHNYELIPLPQQTITEENSNQTCQQLKPAEIQTSPVSKKIEQMRELKQMLNEKLITNEDYEKYKLKILEE